MLHVASVCKPCCILLGSSVAQSFKAVKLLSQQFPTFLLFCDRRSVAQQCWIRLHSSSNIVRATHAHYTWSPKCYGLHHSHDAMRVPSCLRLQSTANMDATTPGIVSLTQQCLEFLDRFARSVRLHLSCIGHFTKQYLPSEQALLDRSESP